MIFDVVFLIVFAAACLYLAIRRIYDWSRGQYR
jgi:hypothetical protein